MDAALANRNVDAWRHLSPVEEEQEKKRKENSRGAGTGWEDFFQYGVRGARLRPGDLGPGSDPRQSPLLCLELHPISTTSNY